MTSIQKYKTTDSDGNMIGYEFHNMVLTGDNSVRGTDLFTVGSIWKDKKTLGNSVSTYLSLTGREMVSEKTTFIAVDMEE